MSVSIQREVKVPTVPKFVRVEGSKTALGIENMDEVTLRQLGEAWTDALIDLAADIRGPSNENVKA